MTPSDADAVANHITSRLTFLSGSSWAEQSYHEDPRWGDTALAPVAALVGDVSRIRYAGGYVGRPSSRDHKVTEVRIVVFTDTQIIRAEADTDPSEESLFLKSAKVWAVRRDTVDAVEVKRASRTDDEAAQQWPRTLELGLQLRDGTLIALPLNPGTYGRDYTGLQELAQALLDA